MKWVEGMWLENDDNHMCDHCGRYPMFVATGKDQLLCGDCDRPIGDGPDGEPAEPYVDPFYHSNFFDTTKETL